MISNTVIDPTLAIEQAAEKLGLALALLPELSEYLRAERAAHDDPQAAEIRRQISAYGEPYFSFEEMPVTLNDLRGKLLALPAIRQLQSSEDALSTAFCEVDDLITRVSGLPFAENIRACGST